MFGFLSYDSPCAQGIYKLANMILLSLMWVVFCVPIFTAGASTTALYYAVQKSIKNDRGNSWACFWQSFKRNFKPTTAITLIFLAIVVVFSMDLAIVTTLREEGITQGYMRALFIVLMVIIAIYACWIYAYIARFNGTVRDYFKNAFILAVMHLPFTLLIALIGALSILAIWLFLPLIFALPSITVWVMSFVMERVFRKYMTEEDKELEDEINMNYLNGYVGKRRDVREAKKAAMETEAAGKPNAAQKVRADTQKGIGSQNTANSVPRRQNSGNGGNKNNSGNVGWKRRG